MGQRTAMTGQAHLSLFADKKLGQDRFRDPAPQNPKVFCLASLWTITLSCQATIISHICLLLHLDVRRGAICTRFIRLLTIDYRGITYVTQRCRKICTSEYGYSLNMYNGIVNVYNSNNSFTDNLSCLQRIADGCGVNYAS